MSFEITTNSWNEAFLWWLFQESYTWADFCKKTPLKINNILEIIEIKKNKISSWCYVKYSSQNYICSVLVKKPPIELLSLAVKTVDKNWVRTEELNKIKYYFKYSYRMSSTYSLLSLQMIFTWITVFFGDWLINKIETYHWLERGSCNMDCAKSLVSVHLILIILAGAIFISMWWPIVFFRWRNKSVPLYTFRTAMLLETLLIVLVSITSGTQFMNHLKSKSGTFKSSYSSIWQSYQAGTLTLPTPKKIKNAP